MFIKDINFQVHFSLYSEKYFCKDFLKKYNKKHWFITKQSIQDSLERSCGLQKTSLIDIIKFSQEDDIGLFKFDFRVAGTSTSPKTSGNRVIFALCNKTGKITILLVYGKDHCKKGQTETQWILEHIKINFPEYKKYC